MTRLLVAAAVFVALSAPLRDAAGDDRTHVALGVGGLSAQPDFQLGLWAGAEVAARHSRWGGRADVYAIGTELEAQLIEGAATYRLGATWPHFSIYGVLGAGVALPDPRLALAAGLSTELGLIKPLALGLLTTLHFVVVEEPEVLLVTVLAVKVSF